MVAVVSQLWTALGLTGLKAPTNELKALGVRCYLRSTATLKVLSADSSGGGGDGVMKALDVCSCLAGRSFGTTLPSDDGVGVIKAMGVLTCLKRLELAHL